MPAEAVIRPGEVYPLAAFAKITGLGRWALRQARRKGLKVRYVNGRAFVLGDDFRAYLSECGADEAPHGVKPGAGTKS